MDHCMYKNEATYMLVHKQLRNAFSLCSWKLLRASRESAKAPAQLALKGNGRWDSDWFINERHAL